MVSFTFSQLHGLEGTDLRTRRPAGCRRSAVVARIHAARKAGTSTPHGPRITSKQPPNKALRAPKLAAPPARRRGVETLAVRLAEPVGNAYVLAPEGQRSLGIVHFIGGALAGAAPQLAYGLLIQLLAEKGYTVITTPYKITFKHKETAAMVHQDFMGAVEELRRSGREDAAPTGARIFGMGHSNGSLLHLLIGSTYDVPNITNILISYNNKQVSDAIPIPGLLDELQPSVGRLVDRLEEIDETAALQSLRLDEYTVTSLGPALEQVEDVFREVSEGITDFSPTPDESRALIQGFYSVPSTLLVKFSVDDFDETDEMAGILSSKYPSGVQVLNLPGTHVSPLGLDYDIQSTQGILPVYLAAAAQKAVVQLDQRRLAARLVSWMRRTVRMRTAPVASLTTAKPDAGRP